jgi:ribosomal protein S18 acetylase RimI-like enzyme
MELILLKPTKDGRYYVKWLKRDFIDAAAALQCYSTHRFMEKSRFEELLTTEPRSDGFVVTDIGNHPLGYILYRHHHEDRMTHFIDLVVHPDHRRNGLGTLLVQWMKRRVPCNFRAILATAREDNDLSHAFLRQNGFYGYAVLENFVDKMAAWCFIYSEDKSEIEKACVRR